jgi:signal transduction histidine kinase
MDFIISFITIVVNLLLGYTVVKKNPKSATNRLFAFLTFIISLWAGANLISLRVFDPNLVIFWIRLVMAIVAMMFPVIYLLAQNFPCNDFVTKKSHLLGILLSILFVQALSMSSLIFAGTSLNGGKIVPSPGKLIPLYGLHVIVYLVLTIVTLIKKIKRAKGREKAQVRIMLFGLSTTFSLAFITTFVFVVVFKFTNLVIVGPVYSLILIISVAYAIVKHKFLDISRLVARTASYTLLMILVTTFYTVLILLAGFFLPNHVDIRYVYFILAIFIAVTLNSFRIEIEKETNKIFFKDRYDPNNLLYILAETMVKMQTLKALTYSVIDVLKKEMKITKILLATRKENKISITGDEHLNRTVRLSLQEFGHLKELNKILIFDELGESMTKNLMRKWEIAIILPLHTKTGFIGFLILGEKESGDIYFDGDIKILDILGPQFAIAVENAQRFEEIGQFNVVLQEEVKKATQELKSANTKLKEADELKDDFISMASHDLRSPLSIVKNNLWVAQNADKIPEKIKESIDIANSSNDHAISLVNDMLDVSRIEMGRVKVTPEKIDLAPIVKEVYENFTLQAQNKGVKLICAKVDQRIFIKADKERIYQIFSNLIVNSLKFTPKGGQITINLEISGSNAKASVEDTGIGIKKSDFPKLFTKFGRLENPIASVSGNPGTGLGLYICKKLVEMFGGKIGVESELDHGSKFFFTIPTCKS